MNLEYSDETYVLSQQELASLRKVVSSVKRRVISSPNSNKRSQDMPDAGVSVTLVQPEYNDSSLRRSGRSRRVTTFTH